MDFWQVILMPFSWLLKTFCQVFTLDTKSNK